ncbi:MAG: hypothetical protein ACLPVY_04010 [Acidimicrobiia bacterium]
MAGHDTCRSWSAQIADQALTKTEMTAEAKASPMTLEAIATAVVERRMRFGPTIPPDTKSF